MNRHCSTFRIVLIVALTTVVNVSDTPSQADEPRLNVVQILVDDLGWMDLSCQGSDYFRTPHIDKLADEGMRFTDAYAACAVCSPTRAAVMTGRSPARVGVTDWIRARFQRGGIGTPEQNPTEYVGGKNRKLLCPPNPYWMEHSEVTIAELLRQAGYATCHIGKWHLGDPAWFPPSQGFDINIAGCDLGQPPHYFDPYENNRYGFDGTLEPRQAGEYLTHREGAEAVAFIRQNKDRPFFLNYCPYAVHTPIQAIDEVAAKYRREGKSEQNAKYAAMVESVDDAVQMVTDELERLELSDRTMIIFTSDNGGLLGPTDNAPLRSGKGYAYEGGIRVPLIIKWPGHIAPGSVSHEPVMSIDLLPTIAAAAGTDLPASLVVDGMSLVPILTADQDSLPPRSLTWHFPHYRHAPGPYSIIRHGEWKLIRFYEGRSELFNLSEDLSEQHNLADTQPEMLTRLERELDLLLRQQGAKLPQPNPDYQTK